MKFMLAVVSALALTGGVITAAPALEVARPTLTTHVPDAVTRRTAKLVGRVAPSYPMDLSISLPLRNEGGLRALLRNVYDPASPLFRHYLTAAEFTAAFGPTASDYASLARFALANGLHPHRPADNRIVLDVSGTARDVERTFGVTIGAYRHASEARIFYAPDREPTLALGVPVLHIAGLDNEALPVSHLVRSATVDGAAKPTGSGPSGNYIGSDIRAAYYGGSALTGTGQSLGLFELGGYDLADVASYFKAVGQKDAVPLVGESVGGADLDCSGTCDDAEQVLDIQEAISMAPGLKQLVVYVGKHPVSILNQMASDDTSKQLSCSWGWKPDAPEIDPILEEFAAQGQSFLVASGDYGYKLLKGDVWPADDQLSTAVGGTDLTTAGPGGAWASETGWRFSGGGPSPDGVAIPSYQQPFVTAGNQGSTTLRNVPDIAGDADTDNYSCYDLACSTGNGGTSYAAPLWAGYIALANQLATALNKPPVGFLNPPLYELGAKARYAKLFHDQTEGYNGAFAAQPGFDLVTGFGSPNGDALLDALARGR
jgi:subtilase family serine protease